MKGKPDLIIGNYTDGNLVASLLSSKLGVTQVLKNIYCSFAQIKKNNFYLSDTI